MTHKIAILASGTGTNATAIMDYAALNSNFVSVVGMISNKKDAPVLQRAEERKVPFAHIPHKYQDRQIDQLNAWGAEWVCLAGYMRIVTSEFLRNFRDDDRGYSRVLNIHPSLLPEFPGMEAYEQAFVAGVQESGVTVHLVDEQLDHGPIILQKSFNREENDNLASFQDRGRKIENQLYVDALIGVLNKSIEPRQQKVL